MQLPPGKRSPDAWALTSLTTALLILSETPDNSSQTREKGSTAPISSGADWVASTCTLRAQDPRAPAPIAFCATPGAPHRPRGARSQSLDELLLAAAEQRASADRKRRGELSGAKTRGVTGERREASPAARERKRRI